MFMICDLKLELKFLIGMKNAIQAVFSIWYDFSF